MIPVLPAAELYILQPTQVILEISSFVLLTCMRWAKLTALSCGMDMGTWPANCISHTITQTFIKSTSLTVQDADSAALTRRTFQQRLNDPPVLSFGPLPKQAAGGPLHESGLALHFSALRSVLPINLHLLTLKALPKDRVLLRLAHLYQVIQRSALRAAVGHVKVAHPVVHLMTYSVARAAIDYI